MKKILAMIMVTTVTAGFMTSNANASCTTIGTYTTCSDGNTYNQIGNTLYGSNSNTGTSWSQTQIGSTTFGYDSDGNSWSHTKTPSGGYGYDSDGNSFSYWD